MNERYWGQAGVEILGPYPPKVVDLSGLVRLSETTLSLFADQFDHKVSMYPSQTRAEQELRTKWKMEMDDLANFLAAIENNPRGLMLIPEMCKQKVDEKYGRSIKRLELIKNTDLKVRMGERKQLSVLVLNLITEEKGTPVIARNLGLDPAESLQRTEEVGLIRVRIYTMKVRINAAGEQTRKNQIGIDVERVYRPELGYLLMVHYCFPNLRNVKASETLTEKNPLFNEAVNETVKCIKRISEQRND